MVVVIDSRFGRSSSFSWGAEKPSPAVDFQLAWHLGGTQFVEHAIDGSQRITGSCVRRRSALSSITDKFCHGLLMPLNIKDPATEKFVRELAALTGETVTAAVRRAAEERLQRVRGKQSGRRLAEELLEIGRRCAALLDQDTRTAQEIIGYDENGVPS